MGMGHWLFAITPLGLLKSLFTESPTPAHNIPRFICTQSIRIAIEHSRSWDTEEIISCCIADRKKIFPTHLTRTPIGHLFRLRPMCQVLSNSQPLLPQTFALVTAAEQSPGNIPPFPSWVALQSVWDSTYLLCDTYPTNTVPSMSPC